MSEHGSDTPGRRDFFRRAAARIVEPLAELISADSPPRVGRTLLRPPGAIDESRFANVCHRCGACVEVCPAHAIFPADASTPNADATPLIDPDLAACVVCEGLVCTTVCPSGALLPLGAPAEIRMGLARVYESACVRSDGEDCTICGDRCPLGTAAIEIRTGELPIVKDDGCVGCGVCQLFCPTAPKAIVIDAEP